MESLLAASEEFASAFGFKVLRFLEGTLGSCSSAGGGVSGFGGNEGDPLVSSSELPKST